MYIALDIGGTKLLAAAFSERHELIRRERIDTPHEFSEGIEALKYLVRRVAGSDAITAIGASAGGPLDFETGVVSPLHMPNWRNVPLKSLFEREFSVPFRVDVDTNAAALAEYTFGELKTDRLLYVTVSTGVGGGLIVNGEVYRGGGGVHPEIGHQVVPYELPVLGPIPCVCGSSDCLEAIVSGTAIKNHYRKPAEKLADEEWLQVGKNLAAGLRNAVALYAPSVIALGGGVCVGGGVPLLETVQRELAKSLMIVPSPRVVASSLGYDSALWGGLVMAVQAKKTPPLVGGGAQKGDKTIITP